MIIKFADNTGTTSMMEALDALSGWTIEGEYSSKGLPTVCSIVKATADGVLICDIDDSGKPTAYSTYLVGYDEIISITLL